MQMLTVITMKFILWASVLLWTCSGLSQTQTPPKEFPSPTKSLQDEKKFNATRLGPGNTITVQQTPPDFQLDSFDFSPDGRLTFMSWASGRLEVRDNETGKRIAQFTPPAMELVPPGWSQGNSQDNCAFRYGETTDFDGTNQFPGRSCT
jgi:hypothetical protein